MKPILALDASGKTAGACILQNGKVLYEEVLDEGLTHSETLLPLAQTALQSTGLAPQDIGLYAVTGGPGSFTGLRIGMALVKGLAAAHGTPALAVSTLHALALGCTMRDESLCGVVVPALDARRSEVYWAAFDSRDGLRRLAPDTASPVEEMARLPAFATGPVFFVGDGAELCYNRYGLCANVRTPALAGPFPIAAGAAFLAQTALAQGSVPPAQEMRPSYLRLSQAQRQRAEALSLQSSDEATKGSGQ